MMYKYIGCEALLNALKEERKNGNFVFTSKWIKEIIDHLPSDDVVPKSEVDILKSLITHKEEEAYERGYAEGKSDVIITNYADQVKEYAREIFEEVEKALNLSKCYGESGIYFEHDIETDIAELKKKYIGESDVKRDTV